MLVLSFVMFLLTQQARVGKTAVARWDVRQKELKAQQLQDEQREQDVLSSSTPENEQKYAFGHHGFGDVRVDYLCYFLFVWDLQ